MPKIYTRRNTNRIPQHDYSKPGYYFITILTLDRAEILGIVENNYMILNEYGNIVNTCFCNIPIKYPTIKLDSCIVMPNHIHGIINIVGAGSPRPDSNEIIGRGNRAPTIGNIMAYYKYQTTKCINKIQNAPGKKIWQRNYYDHIIRNDRSLNRIREYIVNNPANWRFDIENPIHETFASTKKNRQNV